MKLLFYNPTGPLASIFTSMKPKEEVRPPPEDPEKVRLRREFMMSGIPDELKRQIATNVPNIALDYPPFPKPSHVQQLNQEIFNSGCSQAPTLPVGYINEISELQTSGDAHPSWSILEWDAMQVSYPEQSCQVIINNRLSPFLITKMKQDLRLKIFRVPTRSGNREKVGNFVIGREVGKMSGKTKLLKNVVESGKKSYFCTVV